MTLPRAEPRYFGPSARTSFGWLHRPPAALHPEAVGLVICNPFGYEALCAHRSLRHMAETAAALGVPALRFDYHGTGDSPGDDRDPARWEAWLASVHHAVDELRRSTRVERVCLLGLRLGATLAAMVACERDDVAGLVAIAPVVSGKTWLRETRVLQLALGHTAPPRGFELPVGAQESAGFLLTDETREAVARADLNALQRAPAPRVLLIDRDDLPPNTPWAERLIALGSWVDHQRVPGYTEMMLDAHDTIVPGAMLRALSEWLRERILPSEQQSVSALPAPSATTTVSISTSVTESAVSVEDTGRVFGIATFPASTPRPVRAIILLNSGAIHHIGPGRVYVELARRWAAKGHIVLRLDLAGVGDSLPWPGEAENVVYSPWAVRDIAAALRWLHREWGVSSARAVGLCSGAYHALKSAAAELPLDQVVLINPLVFFWKPGMSLAYPAHKVVEAVAQYRRSVLSLDKWKKVFSGKVDVGAFASVALHRVASFVERWARDAARMIGRPMRDDLGAELEAISRRAVGVRFVFAVGDPGEDLLKLQAGSSLPRLVRAGQVVIRRIEGVDHSFTPVWSHARLAELLDADLDAP